MLAGFSLSVLFSIRGIIPSNRGSLPSRFSPGIVVELADRIKAIALDGSLETLRLNRSFDRARSSDRSFFKVAGRFAGAPGLDFDETAGLANSFLGGD